MQQNVNFISSVKLRQKTHFFFFYQIWRVEEDPSSWASFLHKDTEKNLRSYLWQKQVY